ncbi:MAG: response regulator transcription factor [Bacteroidota bacterium]
MDEKRLNLILADDHPVVLEGVKLLFEQSADYQIVATISSEKEIISACIHHNPHILILDLNLGGKNSIELIPELKDRFPQLKILIFSSYQTSVLVKKALSFGIDGYLLKDATKKDWLEALSVIGDGNVFLSKTISHFSNKQLVGMDEFSQITNLSYQEKRIINLIINGLEEKQIATELNISKHTVHTHKKNILKKLNLHTNTELVKFAFENHLTS